MLATADRLTAKYTKCERTKPDLSQSVAEGQSDRSIEPMSGVGRSRRFDPRPITSALPRLADVFRTGRHVSKVPMIGIGGSLAAPPLPHHRTYGSVYGGSRSYADALRSSVSAGRS